MLSLNNVIVLNLSLALTHQTDAAFWREWEMFGLPGGIQLFNAISVVIFLAVLFGRHTTSAVRVSWLAMNLAGPSNSFKPMPSGDFVEIDAG